MCLNPLGKGRQTNTGAQIKPVYLKYLVKGLCNKTTLKKKRKKLSIQSTWMYITPTPLLPHKQDARAPNEGKLGPGFV